MRATLAVLLILVCVCVPSLSHCAEKDDWDALLEESHRLLTDEPARSSFVVKYKTGSLDAKCAMLRFAQHPQQALQEARAIPEPFYASLAIGGIAALQQKSDPAESEKLFGEAQQTAAKITHWMGDDATSLGYLLQLIPGYEAKQARRLLQTAQPPLAATDGDAHRSSHAMRELSRATLQVNPAAAKELLLSQALKSNHYWESIELLARFLTREAPAATLKLAQEYYDAKKDWPMCNDFLRAVLVEDALRDFKSAFAGVKQMQPLDRDIASVMLAERLLAAGRKGEAAEVINYIQALVESKQATFSGVVESLPKLQEAIKKRVSQKPEPRDIIPEQPRIVMPDEIQTFLNKPDVTGFVRIVENREIRFRDRKQANDFITTGLPLAQEVRDMGYPHHGSPRSMAFGTLAVMASVLRQPRQAWEIASKISVPELKVHYLLEAYAVEHPLPPVVRQWPIHFSGRPLINIAKTS